MVEKYRSETTAKFININDSIIDIYKKNIINWLDKEFINVNRDRTNESIDAHVTMFLKISDKKKVLYKCFEIFKALVELSKENDWTNDFVPTLRINLKYTKTIKKLKINSIEDIVKEMNNTPPEIILYRKILFTRKRDGFKEIYKISLHENFNKIFNTVFPEEYKIYYESVKYYDHDFYNRTICENKIYIQYNENNSETVSNIKRLSLKQ